MPTIDITKDDSSSTNNTWGENEIDEFMTQMKKKPSSIIQPVKPNQFKEYRPLQDVEIDDPRPPIKQRMGVESKPAKCPLCKSDRVYSDDREKWICPFCND